MIVRDTTGNIDIDLLEIEDVINLDLLQVFQDNFAESMGIASIILDRNGSPVTNPSNFTDFCMKYIHSSDLGNKRCAESHRTVSQKAAALEKPCIYTCHAGLIDFASPISVGNNQLGTILGGQILCHNPDPCYYKRIAEDLSIDEKDLINAIRSVNIADEKNIRSAAEVLYTIANALSKIGYEELRLKNISENLKTEIFKKNLMLDESEKYNKLKTQLFSTISHELKTPLNIIFSSLQLMESFYAVGKVTSENDIFLKYSKIMKQNCYRLLRLINNLIDMNKIELGFSTLCLKNGNIINVIENITLSVVEYANQKNISLIFDTQLEEKIIAFDCDKLERIILNLLSNAIKFTDSGGQINVDIYEVTDNLFISIKDTGCGIPPDMLYKIFDTFTQVDNSFRRCAEGSGIGLSLVKHLVEMHSGEIIAKSRLGLGSEFLIRLPMKKVKEECYKNVYENDISACLVEKIKIEFSDIYI